MKPSCLRIAAATAATALLTLSTQASAAWSPTRTLASPTDAAITGAAMRGDERLHVAVSLNMRNKASMDALTEALMSGASTRHITPAEFLENFAPTPAQAALVVSHLQRSGFTNVVVATNRMLVTADGSPAAAKTAFDADLRHVGTASGDAFVNITPALVPDTLAGIVNGVHGLQSLHRMHTMMKPGSAVQPNGLFGGFKPPVFSTAYDADSLPAATNATLGIIAQGDLTQTVKDLATFAQRSGYPAPNTRLVYVAANSGDTAGAAEWALDSQDGLAAAGGEVKQMVFYIAPTLEDADLTAAFNRAVSDGTATAINVSLGECENDAQSTGITATWDAIYQTAVAQGQTFSVSSGDSGAYTCGADGGKAQSYPSVSPYVISVGGTLLKLKSNVWSSETVWSCASPASCQQSASGGTGGGVSLTEAAPAWQLASGVLKGSTARGVPDVAFSGDPSSGAILIINGSSSLFPIGGTSLSAPLFAGFWTRLQSKHGNALAFPGPLLYQYGTLGPVKKAFHDITSGSNAGYTAAAGWDYTSGFGSMDIAKLDRLISKAGL